MQKLVMIVVVRLSSTFNGFLFSKIAQLDTEGFDATLEHRPAQGAFR